jgi:hypothetical protein
VRVGVRVRVVWAVANHHAVRVAMRVAMRVVVRALCAGRAVTVAIAVERHDRSGVGRMGGQSRRVGARTVAVVRSGSRGGAIAVGVACARAVGYRHDRGHRHGGRHHSAVRMRVDPMVGQRRDRMRMAVPSAVRVAVAPSGGRLSVRLCVRMTGYALHCSAHNTEIDDDQQHQSRHRNQPAHRVLHLTTNQRPIRLPSLLSVGLQMADGSAHDHAGRQRDSHTCAHSDSRTTDVRVQVSAGRVCARERA